MFDVTPDSTKYYLKELESQATASRRLRDLSAPPADWAALWGRPSGLVAASGSLTARRFVSAVRGVATLIF
jgi:hypothetical protein